jgi:membrane associated rhomboid family serine protease
MSILDDLKLQYKIGNITVRLIFWNLLLFAVPSIVFGVLQLFHVRIDYLNFVSLSTDWSDLLWKPWSILSYAFFHLGIFHIIFNMLMLHFVGQLFLTFFTQKQLFSVYVIGAVFSGLVYMLGYLILPALTTVNTSMVGASAAVMAILMATVSYQPFMEVRLFIFGNVKLWQIALVLIVLDLIQLPMNNTGGHIAHLSGALFGYIYTKFLQNGIDLGSGLNSFTQRIASFFSNQDASPFKKVHVNPKKPILKRESKVVAKDKTQQQIDEILDKISQSGYDSLTSEEKEFLFKAGK